MSISITVAQTASAIPTLFYPLCHEKQCSILNKRKRERYKQCGDSENCPKDKQHRVRGLVGVARFCRSAKVLDA